MISFKSYFRFDALTELGAFMQTDFFYVFSVLRVASDPA